MTDYPLLRRQGEGETVWSPRGRFTMRLTGDESGAYPPPGLAMPSPEVLGPVAERYGIEAVGPPIRAT